MDILELIRQWFRLFVQSALWQIELTDQRPYQNR